MFTGHEEESWTEAALIMEYGPKATLAGPSLTGSMEPLVEDGSVTPIKSACHLSEKRKNTCLTPVTWVSLV